MGVQDREIIDGEDGQGSSIVQKVSHSFRRNEDVH